MKTIKINFALLALMTGSSAVAMQKPTGEYVSKSGDVGKWVSETKTKERVYHEPTKQYWLIQRERNPATGKFSNTKWIRPIPANYDISNEEAE